MTSALILITHDDQTFFVGVPQKDKDGIERWIIRIIMEEISPKSSRTLRFW